MKKNGRKENDKTRADTVMIDPEQLPTPLALTWQALEAETHAFTRMHRLVDNFEVFVKLHTVILLCDYFDRMKVDEDMRKLFVKGLSAPSLGTWWGFARESGKRVKEQKGNEPLPGLLQIVAKDGALFQEAGGKQDNLIKLRNDYAHGATPSEEHCKEHLGRYEPRLRKVVECAEHLKVARLLVTEPDGEVLLARGPRLTPFAHLPGLSPGQCYLLCPDERIIPLHPLLVYRPEDRKLYFYDSLKKAVNAKMLNYDACVHWLDRQLCTHFLERFPIDRWQSALRPEHEEFQERVEALTESFKGRADALDALLEFANRPQGILMIWGAPGIGKSALVARLAQILRGAALVDEMSRELPPSPADVEVVLYFIRRDQRTDDASLLLDNINGRIKEAYRTGLPLGSTVREKAALLTKQLQAISNKLSSNQRFLLCVDGLDEGADAEALLASLPLTVPKGILLIFTSRPNALVRDQVYDRIDREQRHEMSLLGIGSNDVRALLYEYVNKYAIREEYVQAVKDRSEGNPLYLKLLCEGLSAGDYGLNDIDRLPKKMMDIYHDQLKRLNKVPGAFDFLMLLAAARDYLTPSSVARLLERDTTEIVFEALPACGELLQPDGQASGGGKIAVFAQPEQSAYQLFHESLRDYLREQYPSEIKRKAERLADWCRAWSDCELSDRRYAVHYALSHLDDSAARALEKEDHEQAELRVEQMCALIESSAFREAVFLHVGNAGPLQRGIMLAQRHLIRRDRNGSELRRIVAYTRLYHDEPHRLYNEQLKRMDDCARSPDPNALSPLVGLAQMGRRPSERVLLVLRTIWAAPKRLSIPVILRETVDDWLFQAKDPALSALWQETMERCRG